MALTFASTSLPVGNIVFGLSSSVTTELWGFTFVENRFALTLVKSDSSVYWKKVDSYQTTAISYDMLFTPASIGIGASDHTRAGQFLFVEGDYIYYFNGSSVTRSLYEDGTAAGSFIPRNSDSTVLLESDVDAILVKGTNLYLASKSKGKVLRYDLSTQLWTGTNTVPATSVNVSELATDAVCGLFAQTGDTDIVLLLRGSAKRAIKMTSLLVRRGVTTWSEPTSNVHAAQFLGSILYVVQNDSSIAGTGVTMLRFGDESTGVVAQEQTLLNVSKDRVRAGSDEVVTVTYTARDGYGINFPISEKVRFALVKLGDSFDDDDAALATTSNSTFRDSVGRPLNTFLDVNFNSQGQAIVYWQSPKRVPLKSILHRIRVKYPIY